MTDDRMTLMELVEKSADEDLVRDMLAYPLRCIARTGVRVPFGAPVAASTFISMSLSAA